MQAVGIVALVIIWKAQGYSWPLTALISTPRVGVQEPMKAWRARWRLEVAHRTRKQTLALGNGRCFSYAAPRQHADLVSAAFTFIRQERQRTPKLSWKQAQQTALRLKHALLTGVSRLAA